MAAHARLADNPTTDSPEPRGLSHPPVEARATHAHVGLLCLALVLAIATAALIAAPHLRPGVVIAAVRQPLAVAITVVSLFTCALAYLWFSLTGSRSTLLIAVAFLIAGLSQFILTVVLGPEHLNTLERHLVAYLYALSRLVPAALLVAAGIERRRPRRPVSHPFTMFVVVTVASATSLVVLGLILWAVRHHVPALNASWQGTSLGVVIALLGAGALLVAAYLLRSDPTDDVPPRGDWLSAVLVLAAFSHLNYILAAPLTRGQYSTGDLLRSAEFLILFFGLIWEMRTLLERHERERRSAMVSMIVMRNEVSKVVTHDLVHGIATLRAFSFSLARRWDEMGESDRHAAADTIEHQSAGIARLAEETVSALNLAPDSMASTMQRARAADLIRDAAIAADRMDGRIELQVEPDAEGAEVLADVDAISRVLANLLWNAQQHSGKATPVVLRLRATRRDAVFEVADRGEGIPRRRLRRIMSGSWQSPESVARPGAGVGLYLSTAVVEAHGGRIWARSRVGEGSTFSFSLPRDDARDPRDG